MTVLFISDLHLTAGDAETTRRFVDFMDGPARAASELYILGDLFEAWIGDDDPEPSHRDVIAAISAVAAAGTLVYAMRGNRDFMLGERFCRDAGAILLDDPAIMTLHGERLVLSHGDGLCVDDRPYQRLRALVRDASLRAGFERLPIEARRRLASEARAGSREHLANAASYITDVNPAAVEALFRDTDAALMIHGHTHRPAVHRPGPGGADHTRIVLGAWHDEANVVRWDTSGWQLMPCPA